MQRVKPRFEDLYPLHYPKHVYLKYEEMRRIVVREALEKVEEELTVKRFEEKVKEKFKPLTDKAHREKLRQLALELLEEGYDKNIIAKLLMALGIPRSTAYYWLSKV